MSVVSVKARSFILALFIRDDGERFLLGDNGYDFKGTQLHFAANTIENDEVMKQGADGVIVAGQVRRASVQSFDGFVGDATMAKETIEQMRRDFFAFFIKGHHFRVVYVDCNRNAWQRKGGYLVDAPEVKELWQIHPEYHVGLNFEDVNYYSYDEDADGEEILSNLVDVPVSTAASGGLVWDEDGAVSEDAEVDYDSETAEASGKSISISDAAEAPLASFQLDGETSQNGTPTPDAPVAVQTVTGENVVKICGKNLFDKDAISTGYLNADSTLSSDQAYKTSDFIAVKPNTAYYKTYTASPRTKYYNSARQPLNTTTYQDIPIGGAAGTFTTPADAAYVRFSLPVAGVNLDTTQLEKGSTATAYEPYQGQSYEVNLDIPTGKNLLNPNWSFSRQYYGTDGTLNDFYYFALFDKYFEVEPNTTYSFSSSHSNSNMAIAWFDDSKTFISRSASGTTSISETSPANARYARLQIRYDADTVITTALLNTINIQFEKGAVSLYEPYQPIELCKIPGTDYRDRFIPRDGKWYVRKECGKVVLNGGESWATALASIWGNNAYLCTDITNLKAWGSTCSDYFVDAGLSQGAVIQSGYMQMAGSGIVIRNDNTTTVANLKTWLGSNNVSIYYQLATPTDTEITNEALIAQLNALLTTARTYAGINNITTITPNEQGTLEVGYYTKYQPIVAGGGYVWEAGGAGGATIVVNNSIDNVNPIWKIYGPTMNPRLENSTTGETIEYVGLIAEGQTLTIDMGEQTASLDGLNVISNLVGDFVSLAPGANRLIYSVSGDAGASEIGWSEIVG